MISSIDCLQTSCRNVLGALASIVLSFSYHTSWENAITPQIDQTLPQLAASHYLNSAPLIWSFIHGPRKAAATLIDAVPALCADLLETGEVEGALVPVIEYQRIPEILVVPGVCVGSRRSVRSVVLVTKVNDLRDVRSVALDESSRTSAALMKILFLEFLGIEPKWVTTAPDVERMLIENDAALVIGDPAMTFSRKDLRIFDMASLWRDYTGLGFVFAVWAVRAGDLEKFRNIDFAAARDEGLEKIEEIVSHYQKEIPLSRAELKEYLTDNISFQIDERMEDGLKLYFELAWKHGLIPQLKPLQFLEPSLPVKP
ncbi:MAG: menaquinone biosynthetic enzyme MqnA/MqnD family protein [Pyrinomonadaceae bacterium]